MFGEKFLAALLVGLALGDVSLSTSKIDSTLREIYNSRVGSKVNIFVEMREGNEKVLRSITTTSFSTRAERISTMKTRLETLSSESQKGVLSILKETNATFTSFWINNQVFIRDAPLELVEKLEQDPQVSSIREEMIYHIMDSTPSKDTTELEWGLDKIEVQQAWNLHGGNRGERIVVAITDTGVRYTHEALRNNFREEYGWLDPIDPRRGFPNDENGHGTHVAGILVGSNGIGVAPGAEWIACRGCRTLNCNEAALIKCGEWTTCPTLTGGSFPDCSMAPHISSNSWGGGQNSPAYLSVVNAWHAAGIIPVFAQGNTGPGCGTAMSPGDLPNVIAVGSTDIFDSIAANSSRGPVVVSGIVKPDISAPGIKIRSASHDGDDQYTLLSGTSMAAPHVSGVIALLKGADPSLSYEQIKTLIQDNAETYLGIAQTCGNTPITQIPNNIYGYGRINAYKSLQVLLESKKNDATSGIMLVWSFEKSIFYFVLSYVSQTLML